jgi:hypothetical protein
MGNGGRSFLIACALAFSIAARAETIHLTPGDRVSVRNAWGSTKIAVGTGNDVVVSGAATVARSAADRHLVVIATRSAEGSPVDLTLRVPRGVALHAFADTGHIVMEGISSNVEVETKRANVTATDIDGNVVVTTGNGNVTIDRVKGLVDVTSGNGNTRIMNVEHSVHVVSINGKTEIQCVTGAVSVKDTSGRVTVINSSGDVDLFTAMGNASYHGVVQPDRSYRLKTLSGAIALRYSTNGHGFTGRVTSHSGKITIDNALGTFAHKPPNRIDVRTGDGSARLLLDSFDGRIELKPSAEKFAQCANMN